MTMKKAASRRKTPPRGKRRSPPRAAARSLTAKLVRIGNSRGVRLPKALIEQAGLVEEVVITLRGNGIMIRPAEAPHPRAGWEEQIKKVLAEHGDDINDWRDWQAMPNKFDEEEWTW